jgi:hypothetical protein
MAAAAASLVVVFQTMDAAQQPSPTVLEGIKRREGFERAFYGVKMEEPETGVLCTGASFFLSFSLFLPLSCHHSPLGWIPT